MTVYLAFPHWTRHSDNVASVPAERVVARSQPVEEVAAVPAAAEV
jgi:hypothetical protein